jgi:hypothetical protein
MSAENNARAVVKYRDPTRGRPRRQLPPLSLRIFEWVEVTRWGRTKVHDEINAGRLRAFRPKPNSPQEIPTTELIRLGYIQNLYELTAILPPRRRLAATKAETEAARTTT